jgi:membrane-associated progesterone receptor component
MPKYQNLAGRSGNSSFFLQKTNDGHDATMKHPFMKTIYDMSYDRSAYGAYLWSQYQVFTALEGAITPLKDDPIIAPVYDEHLHRKAALEVDLGFWLGGKEIPQEAKYDQMRSITDSYIRGLNEESHDAKALLCHHFLHYNAVLSGGQFLSGKLCSKENISIGTNPAGVSFYVFPELAVKAHARVQQYLKAMDSIELSDEDRDRMLVIMKRVYDDMEKVFDAAYEITPRDGQGYGKTKENELPISDESVEKHLRLTPQALRQYDGRDGSRIILSLSGNLVDVTAGAEAYGPGGSYQMFAGHDVTKCLALMDLSESSLDDFDFVPETDDAKKSLESWHNRLTSKYPIVGKLVKPLRLIPQTLRQYNGAEGGRILLSLQGKVIDVTGGAESYGPGGSYHLFAGHDVTKCLALMDLNEASLDDLDFVPETEDAKKSLDSWLSRLTSKYDVVGDLVPPVSLTLEELHAFDGKDGGSIYVSLSGRIIDVTQGASSYGPDGSYSLFGGHDVTKNLSLMDLSAESLDQPQFIPPTEEAKKSLDTWWNRLTSKYPHVGEVVPSHKL